MKNLKKYSFSLIELIIAIIIIGIAVTSIPMLLNSSSKSSEINLVEKSFFNAYALLTLIQTEEWDENNTKDDNYYKVLTSLNGDNNLKCIRKGVYELNNSSGANCDDNTTSKIGPDDGENNVSQYDDVDDFNNYSTIVNDFNISVKVNYIYDNANYDDKNIYFNAERLKNSDSNIKFVELNIRNKDTNKIISVLKYFTSNIGAVKIESRSE